MAKNHCRKDTNQELRIARLKQEAAQRAGGQMVSWESETLSADEREKFWRRVLAFESPRTTTTDFERLTEAGVELPPPEAMTDERLAKKLWEVIDALARLRVFLSYTDHLSDRQLYTELWGRVLREETESCDDATEGAWHVDLIGTGSEEHIQLHLKYYADDDDRRRWMRDFPDCQMPAHEDPPYDRDARLPQPDYGV